MRGGAVAARRAHNPKVAGSSPAPATKKTMTNSWSLFLRSARSAQIAAPVTTYMTIEDRLPGRRGVMKGVTNIVVSHDNPFGDLAVME